MVGVLPLYEVGSHVVLKTGKWRENHIPTLREHAVHADVVYTRWQDEDGNEFPFSPYDRAAHLGGLNFVGTDVAMSQKAFHLYQRYIGNIDDCLRHVAENDDVSFLGVDAVTYTRRKSNVV